MNHRHTIWVLDLNGAIKEFQLGERAVQDFAVEYSDCIYFFARMVLQTIELETD